MVQRPLADARWFQILFQAFFLSYGLLFLHWNADWPHYLTSITGCLIFSYIAEAVRRKQLPAIKGTNGLKAWGLSALISALSLCLLLKTNNIYVSLLAAFLTVASKSIFRLKRKHIFNPSAFGITATILITKDAWLSPGQWGNRVLLPPGPDPRDDSGFKGTEEHGHQPPGFLLTFGALLYWHLEWSPWAGPRIIFWHSISGGSFCFSSFFMISDPKTAPNHPVAKFLWAMMIGVVSFLSVRLSVDKQYAGLDAGGACCR